MDYIKLTDRYLRAIGILEVLNEIKLALVKLNSDESKELDLGKICANKLNAVKKALRTTFFKEHMTDKQVLEALSPTFSSYPSLRAAIRIVFSNQSLEEMIASLKQSTDESEDWQPDIESHYQRLNKDFDYFPDTQTFKDLFMQLVVPLHKIYVLIEKKNTLNDSMAYNYAYKLMALMIDVTRYELCLRSSLQDKVNLKYCKVYLSENGEYVVRDPKRGLINDTLPENLLKKLEDSASKLDDPTFRESVLSITSKRGHTHATQPLPNFNALSVRIHQLLQSTAQTATPYYDLLYALPLEKASFIMDKVGWLSFIKKYHAQALPFLCSVRDIERRFERAPSDLAEAEGFIALLKYKDAMKNRQWAFLCHQNKVGEDIFNEGLVFISYLEKTCPKKAIPEVIAEHNGYVLTNLSATDYRMLILGVYTDCCQSIARQGAQCIIDAIRHPENGFYVLLKSKKNHQEYSRMRPA